MNDIKIVIKLLKELGYNTIIKTPIEKDYLFVSISNNSKGYKYLRVNEFGYIVCKDDNIIIYEYNKFINILIDEVRISKIKKIRCKIK